MMMMMMIVMVLIMNVHPCEVVRPVNPNCGSPDRLRLSACSRPV